jgi:mannose-1-phosphate guanylyltransferase
MPSNPRESLEAILLVGGQGTRLRPLTIATPKPLIPTAGVPFLAHQLAKAAAYGVTRVLMATFYRAEMFAECLGDGPSFGLRSTTSRRRRRSTPGARSATPRPHWAAARAIQWSC